MSTTRSRDLDNLAHRVDRLANHIADTYEHLDEQRANIAVLSAHDYTAGAPSSDTPNPTLRTVQQLDAVEHHRKELNDAIATLQVCVKMLEDANRNALHYRAGTHQPDTLDHLDDEPTCLDCQQIPVPRRDLTTGLTVDDGRCLDHGTLYDHQQAERRRSTTNRRLLRHASKT